MNQDTGDDADLLCEWYEQGHIKASVQTGQVHPCVPGCCGATLEEWERNIRSWSFDDNEQWKRERERIALLEAEWEAHKQTREDDFKPIGVRNE